MTDIRTEVGRPKLKPGTKHKYLREQYQPHRKNAQDTLSETGYNPEIHRQLKARLAKEYFKKASDAETDELTGLLTRKGLMRRLNEEIARSKRMGHNSTLVMIDANGLKRINDTYGHQAGDERIREIAAILLEETRITDIRGRIGGDEFCILLSDTNSADTNDWWRRVNKRFEEKGISISAGSSVITPELAEIKTINYFLTEADSCMYSAKFESKIKGENIYLHK